MLIYEILLTRISALRLVFHFSFLVVSNFLLGIAVSGTLLMIFQKDLFRRTRVWISLFSALYIVSLSVTYGFLLHFPIGADWDSVWSEQPVRFLIFSLGGALPFFWRGCVVGLILMAQARQVHLIYCFDLLGAGAGCLLSSLLLSRYGARYIKGVELYGQILDVHTKTVPGYSRTLVEDPKIELVAAEGRSAIVREQEEYDIIQMTGIDTWSGLLSCAAVLSENYLYTVEALRGMMGRLAKDGILQITRLADDLEGLRLLVNLHVAVDGVGGDMNLKTP
jgi:hypothetical protein